MGQATEAEAPAQAPVNGEAEPGMAPGTEEEQPNQVEALRELGVDVEVETLPDLDVIILRGRQRDVEEVRKIIEEIERISAETQPAIEIYPLRHVGGEALLTVMHQVQADLFTGRQGRVTMIPLVKPNALLLIGWGDAVLAAKEAISKLDRPVKPDALQRVFPLKYASAAGVRTTINEFFTNRTGGLASRVSISADARTNSLVVHAPPREMEEVALLVEKLDVATTATVMQSRIFRLENTLAPDLYVTLQSAIEAARGGRRQLSGRRPWNCSRWTRRERRWSNRASSATCGSRRMRG